MKCYKAKLKRESSGNVGIRFWILSDTLTSSEEVLPLVYNALESEHTVVSISVQSASHIPSRCTGAGTGLRGGP